jgi:hypothetical protein
LIKRKWYNYVLVLVIFSIALYVIARAFLLSFTIDESISFGIVNGNLLPKTAANNHFLNTWLMSISNRLFGSSEFSLRSPNIMGFCFYAFACFNFLKNKKAIIVLLGITFLLANPYLIDFFSLARGYGIALGFAMMALYYCLKTTQTASLSQFAKNGVISLLFCLLSSTANLNFVNLYFAVLFLILIEFAFRYKTVKLNWNFKLVIYLSVTCILNMMWICLLIHQLLKLSGENELYWGGYSGFFTDTVGSLISASFYQKDYGNGFQVILQWMLVVSFLIILTAQLFSRRNIQLVRLTALLAFLFSAIVAEHYIFSTPYPMLRTALIFIPVLGLFYLFTIDKMLSRVKNENLQLKISFVVFIIICQPLIYNFVKSANLTHVEEWDFDSNTKNASGKIRDICQEKNNCKREFTIANSWQFTHTLNYYKNIYSVNNLEKATINKINLFSDFMYLYAKDTVYINNSYSIIERFPDSKSILLRRNEINFGRIVLSSKTISLKASNNKNLCAHSDMGNSIIANIDYVGSWETFLLVMFNNNECAILSYQNNFLCANLDKQNEIIANRNALGAWETFTIYKLKNNLVAFKAANGKYLSVDGGGGGGIYANSNELSKMATFEVTGEK